MRKIRALILLGVAAAFVGCSTVTIRPEGTAKMSTDPTWSESKSYYLWGLVGTHQVDVDQACGGRGVKQMQAQDTFLDGLLQILTLGIYYPRTAKVWCN